MPQIAPSLPIVGQPDTTEEPKVLSALQALVAAINGNIDGANITDGALTGLDIQDLSVATADLADKAVTTPKVAPDVGTATLTANPSPLGSAYTTLRTLTFTTTVNTVEIIDGQCAYHASFSGPTGNLGTVFVDTQLVVDGSANAFAPRSGSASDKVSDFYDTLTGHWVVNLAPGNHTVLLQARQTIFGPVSVAVTASNLRRLSFAR